MTVTLEGTVTSGLGRGAEFVALEGYAHQFDELHGYEPYPGTLNLDLSRPIGEEYDELDGVRIEGWEDGDRSFGAVSCYPASVPGTDDPVALHVTVSDRTDHDTATCELVAPVNRRERFDLADGSTLEVRVECATDGH